MQHRSIVALVVGLTAVACVSGVLEPPPQRPSVAVVAEVEVSDQDTPAVVGVVHDAATGEAIAGALLVLQCAGVDNKTRETTTDANGRYAFTQLPPGKYSLHVLFGQANVSKTFVLAPDKAFRVNFSIDPDRRFIIT